MPSADDYYQATIAWNDAAYQCGVMATELAWSLPESRLGHCPVRVPLDNAIGVSIQNLEKSARDFESLRDECKRRMLVCGAFDNELALHQSSLDQWSALPEEQRGERPAEPSPPYPWVEASS